MTSLMDTLDITLWQARMPLPGAKKTLNYQAVTLVDSKQRQAGVILIERGASLGEKETVLLREVLVAAGLVLGAVVAIDQVDKIGGVVIAICETGDIPAEIQELIANTHSTCTQLAHPSQCLLSAKIKRQVWQQMVQSGLIR